jgi:hypothetical protein
MPNSNLERLIATAALLRPMLGDLVFVGGAVTSLLVTDEGASLPRTTLDVDAIAEITSYAKYAAFGERLRALGFSEAASEGAPLCRWVHSGMILDVMPLDAKILQSLVSCRYASRDHAPSVSGSEDPGCDRTVLLGHENRRVQRSWPRRLLREP